MYGIAAGNDEETIQMSSLELHCMTRRLASLSAGEGGIRREGGRVRREGGGVRRERGGVKSQEEASLAYI